MILAAAQREFALTGFSGARIERIAAEAQCNRALVYFYFKNKGALFEAALDEAAEHRSRQIGAQPQTLAEGLIYWFGQNFAEPTRIRLIMQEALADTFEASIPARRQAYLDEQVGIVRAFQQRGLLRGDIDPRHLLTIFLALTSFPACFPKIASVSLAVADETQLQEEWKTCLKTIADLLAPPSPQP